MPTLLLLMFGFLTILATVFASDIREFLIAKAIDWEEKIHNITPALQERLNKLKQKEKDDSNEKSL